MRARSLDADDHGAAMPRSAATLQRPAGPLAQIVSFRLANEEYAVDIMCAREIIMVSPITRIPEVPDYVRGLINLRGQVISIVDLRKRFELPAQAMDGHTRIIVVNVESRTIGIIVDAVTEVLRITADQIEPPPAGSAGIGHDYIRGIIQRNGKLIILLRIEEILSASALATIGRAAERIGDSDWKRNHDPPG